MRISTLLYMLAAIATAGILGCSSNSTNSGDKKSDGTKVTVHGSMSKSLAKLSLASEIVADSIIAVPFVEGQMQGGWAKLPSAEIQGDGTFSILLDRLFNEKEVEWILLLLNSKAATRYDQVLGFLSIQELGQSMIQFPISKSKGDSIDCGKMEKDGDEIKSDTSIYADSAVFDMTLQQLTQLAHTGQTLKVIKNSYGNFDPVSQKGIDIRAIYNLAIVKIDDIRNHELLPAEYLDTSKFFYNLQAFSGPNLVYDSSAIASGSDVYGMVPPSPMAIQHTDANDQVFVSEATLIFSTDTMQNPMIDLDTEGNQGHVGAPFFIGGSSVTSLLYHGFKGISPEGTWKYTKNGSTVISQFDLSLGTPFNAETGKPTIYVPSLQVNTTADSTITNVTVRWYYWNDDEKAYSLATDEDMLRKAISEYTIYLYNSIGELKESFEFGTQANGTVNGEIKATTVVIPKNKWVHADPSVYRQKYTVGIDYTTYMQTFGIFAQGNKTQQ